MELNKIIGGACATLLVWLGLNFFAELIYHEAEHHGEDHHLAYAIEIEDDVDEGGDDAGPDLAALFAAADASKGEKVFNKCKACHKIEDGANGVGPHLYGILNRGIGSVAGANYSGKLPADQAWTAENLFAFLTKPKAFAPGTSMGFAGLKKDEDKANLIAWLNETDGSPDPLP